ncbi:MAG TPA: transcriptional repressor LexA [Clostridia bacterium]|nr:transcriptional repressor LexA [Clostridia bacterium]
MYEDLSQRQVEILHYIQKVTREKGYPPSVREIGQAVGLSSSSTVHGHLAQLEAKGYIRRDPAKPRAIEILDTDGFPETQPLVQVPLLGRITAGNPILATQHIEQIVPLPFDLVRTQDVFMLSVVGDSMIEAGIYDGDYVIVKQQPTAENGDIVAAMLDDEATVKRFYKEKDCIRLQPENPKYSPILTREVTILGKVIGLYRRLG